MFWVIALILVFGMIIIGQVYELFQSMKTSEFEIIRKFYWVLVVGIWVTAIVWLINL